jgi:hypothetical protein
VPGTTYAGRSIYTSFGLEGMSESFNATYGITPTSRAGLLNAIVVWLNTEPGTVTVTPTLIVSTTLYTFDYDFARRTRRTRVPTTPVQVRWDFGDGSPYVVAGADGTASRQYVCADDNVHTVRAEVTDTLGIVAIGEVTIDVSDSCNVGRSARRRSSCRS